MTNENDYEPYSILDDLKTVSGKSISELSEEYDSRAPWYESVIEDDEECSSGDYPDCDTEFDKLWKKLNELEEIVNMLYETVYKRKGPIVK